MTSTPATTSTSSTSGQAVKTAGAGSPAAETTSGLAATVATPLGDLVLVADDGALVEIRLPSPAQPLPRTPRPYLPPLDRPTRNASATHLPPLDTPVRRASGSSASVPPLDTPVRRASGTPRAPLPPLDTPARRASAFETDESATDAAFETHPSAGADAAILAAAERQLDEYFAGRRHAFDLPLRLRGTRFQRDVWEALLGVDYGTTTSYSAIAERIGRPGAQRAVGAAVGSNPLAVVVPCHRIVGADGGLTGYGGGLPRKRYLLELERAD